MAYDVSKAFERIENDLLDSMIRNLGRHKAEETAEGFEWEQWQVAQLKELERFKRANAKNIAKSLPISIARFPQLSKKPISKAWMMRKCLSWKLSRTVLNLTVEKIT